MGRDQSHIRIMGLVHVPLNMLKLSNISYTDISKSVQLLLLVFLIYISCFFFFHVMLSSNINVKNLTFTPYCGVGVCVCVWGGGGYQDVITIQTSTMTPLSATVSHVDLCWRVGQWLQMHFTWYMRALNNNGNEHRQ